MAKRVRQEAYDEPVIKSSNRGRRWKPQNDAQQRCWDMISENTVTIILGPAGTSKTHTAMSWALEAVRLEQFERIILTRPIVTATEDLGFLPGDINSKVSPFHRPQTEIVAKVDRTIPVEMTPLAFLRGVTLSDAVCVGDEFQNCTAGQLKLYLSRLGPGSKMCVCGDTDQSDIRESGLYAAAESLRGLADVGIFEFTKADIVRHPLIGKMLDRLPR